jgi:hypothetical protein
VCVCERERNLEEELVGDAKRPAPRDGEGLQHLSCEFKVQDFGLSV